MSRLFCLILLLVLSLMIQYESGQVSFYSEPDGLVWQADVIVLFIGFRYIKHFSLSWDFCWSVSGLGVSHTKTVVDLHAVEELSWWWLLTGVSKYVVRALVISMSLVLCRICETAAIAISVRLLLWWCLVWMLYCWAGHKRSESCQIWSMVHCWKWFSLIHCPLKAFSLCDNGTF